MAENGEQGEGRAGQRAAAQAGAGVGGAAGRQSACSLGGTTGGAGRVWNQGACCRSLSFPQTHTEHVLCGLAWEVGLGDAQSAARGTLTTHECT